MADEKAEAAPKKKKGGFMKILMLGVGGLVLVGGGVGGAVFAMNAGLFGGAKAEAAGHADEPKLLPKEEEKRASLSGDSGGGHGDESGGGSGGHGMPTPKGEGGDKYASSYYQFEKEFTANLQDSVHFIQVGIAVSTPYDERVLENIKTHEIAIRSAVLTSLAETSEEEVFTAEGKKAIQNRLVKSVNATLKEKEGFGGVSNVYFTNFIVQ